MRNQISFLCSAMGFVLLGLGIILRFQHPELSETQLFLNYGILWLASIGFLLIGIFIGRIR